MNKFIKTSFQVTEEQLDFLQAYSEIEKRSVAGMLRIIIDDYMERAKLQSALTAAHARNAARADLATETP